MSSTVPTDHGPASSGPLSPLVEVGLWTQRVAAEGIDTGMSSAHVALLFVVAQYQRWNPASTASQPTLAAAAGTTDKPARVALAELVANGWLSRTEVKTFRGREVHYTVTLSTGRPLPPRGGSGQINRTPGGDPVKSTGGVRSNQPMKRSDPLREIGGGGSLGACAPAGPPALPPGMRSATQDFRSEAEGEGDPAGEALDGAAPTADEILDAIGAPSPTSEPLPIVYASSKHSKPTTSERRTSASPSPSQTAGGRIPGGRGDSPEGGVAPSDPDQTHAPAHPRPSFGIDWIRAAYARSEREGRILHALLACGFNDLLEVQDRSQRDRFVQAVMDVRPDSDRVTFDDDTVLLAIRKASDIRTGVTGGRAAKWKAYHSTMGPTEAETTTTKLALNRFSYDLDRDQLRANLYTWIQRERGIAHAEDAWWDAHRGAVALRALKKPIANPTPMEAVVQDALWAEALPELSFCNPFKRTPDGRLVEVEDLAAIPEEPSPSRIRRHADEKFIRKLAAEATKLGLTHEEVHERLTAAAKFADIRGQGSARSGPPRYLTRTAARTWVLRRLALTKDEAVGRASEAENKRLDALETPQAPQAPIPEKAKPDLSPEEKEPTPEELAAIFTKAKLPEFKRVPITPERRAEREHEEELRAIGRCRS